MRKYYTAESVTEGHPDKLCDQIADRVLDDCLSKDPDARVACEAMTMGERVIVAGEITSTHIPRVPALVHQVFEDAGYDPKTLLLDIYLRRQSPDITAGVNMSLEERNGTCKAGMGAGDQGIMVGYACSETPEKMPLAVVLAHRIAKRMAEVRKSGEIEGLMPDGKTQVTLEYEEDVPLRVDTIVVSAQHGAEIHRRRFERAIREQVLVPALRPMPADGHTQILINPSGRFVLGGPTADTGLTGRKLAVDCYGVFAPNGGGALSGKDATKVDRSGAYMARYIAKNIVAAGLAARCQVTLSYAIGKAQPVHVAVDTFGTGTACEDDCLALAVRQVFDLTPSGMIQALGLTRPIFARTACYGHFGRTGFPWEREDRIRELKKAVL